MTNLALRQIMIKFAQTKIRTALQNDEVQRCLIRAKSDFQHTESGVPQQVTLKFKVLVGPPLLSSHRNVAAFFTFYI